MTETDINTHRVTVAANPCPEKQNQDGRINPHKESGESNEYSQTLTCRSDSFSQEEASDKTQLSEEASKCIFNITKVNADRKPDSAHNLSFAIDDSEQVKPIFDQAMESSDQNSEHATKDKYLTSDEKIEQMLRAAYDLKEKKTPKQYVKKKNFGFDDKQDAKLLDQVKRFGENAWSRISKNLGKSEIKCHKRYLELSDRSHMVSASWTKKEDELLTSTVLANGAKDWTKVAMLLPGRIGKQCRERWHHHLNPEVIKKKWSFDEDVLILKLHKKFGTRWSEISKHVSGRSDNQIKNRYNSNLKKRLNEGLFSRFLEVALTESELAKLLETPQSPKSSDSCKNNSESQSVTIKSNNQYGQKSEATSETPTPKTNIGTVNQDTPTGLSCAQRRQQKLMNKQGSSSDDQSPLEASNETQEHSVESKEQQQPTAADPGVNVKFTFGKSPCVMKFSFWSSQKAVKHIARISQESFANTTAASESSKLFARDSSEVKSDKMCQQEDASMSVPVNAATMSTSGKDQSESMTPQSPCSMKTYDGSIISKRQRLSPEPGREQMTNSCENSAHNEMSDSNAATMAMLKAKDSCFDNLDRILGETSDSGDGSFDADHYEFRSRQNQAECSDPRQIVAIQCKGSMNRAYCIPILQQVC